MWHGICFLNTNSPSLYFQIHLFLLCTCIILVDVSLSLKYKQLKLESSMHCDTRLVLYLLCLSLVDSEYSDDQSYLSMIEFHRGGDSTKLILASPHGGFLGANPITRKDTKISTNDQLSASLVPLPIGGCYNNTLERCVFTLRDCLRTDLADDEKLLFYADARCVLDRSSTSAMHSLTKSIADSFLPLNRPYLVLNKLTRQFVDPAEDLLVGTFLMEGAVRTYTDYHRLIAMSKEAIRPNLRGLFIELVFHKNSQTIQLGYGFETSSTMIITKPTHSTIIELLSRSGPSVIRGNQSLAFFLRQNGFQYVTPFEPQSQHPQQENIAIRNRLSSYSTRTHADQRFNAILFSYPIERLRTHSIRSESARIAKAIEQFLSVNQIQTSRSSSPNFIYSSVICFLLFYVCFSFSFIIDINV